VLPHPKMGDALLNSVVTLTLETIQEGNSVLIFCSSRMMTVDTAVTSLVDALNVENDCIVYKGFF
jgi:replicative superfamily II helicase